jgi:hypothetical protein
MSKTELAGKDFEHAMPAIILSVRFARGHGKEE